ncbi:polysaccharide biosynthesis tyrosine autokinase [Pleurocapsa sp. PCC 7319]|uniref:GumC family protein n=1 Tax=Pleurocapsa sp. PCC 7319 TaxID=118161 RepID=UPI0003455D8F|nr:polysaccharide biosynthesis tyrosine autokinase [Pleurocapsa sp. PCC 7319]
MYPSQTSVGVDQYWEIVKRRWLPGSVVFLSVLTLGVVATSLKENIYQAEAKLKFKESTVSSSLSESSRALGAFSPVADKGNPIDTEAEVLRSVPLIKKTISDPEIELKNEEGERISVSAFQNKLKVGSIPGTDILQVSFASKNPEEAAKVVNTLVRNYLENNTVVNRAEAVSAREFLEEQLPKVEDALQRTEAEIRQLKESNEFVSPDEDTKALIDSIQEVQSEIAKAKGQINNARSQANYLKDKLGLNSEQAVILNTISQSPEIRETIAKLQQAESELATAQARYTANSPNVIELKEQIGSLEKLLDQQTQSVGGEQAKELLKNSKSGMIQQELTSELIKLEANNIGLQKQIDSLTETEQNRRVKIKQVPQIEQKLRLLERQVKSFESTYDILWQQLQTVRIAESQDPGNVRVISNAVIPNKPVSSRAVGYLASGSLALLAAAGIIYLLEITDKSIKTVEEARQLFGYDSLGVIPSLDKSKLSSLPPESEQDQLIPRLVVGGYPSLPQSESYRMLQSNIQFLNSDATIKSVVVTSSSSQEGKSTVAANLAAAMAQVGNKVLLVDANLHSPIQHRIWDIYNNNGLSNVIAEQIDPRTVTEKVMPNLDLLTSGVIAPSPAALLDSQRMRMLMDYWTERYDFVILDTPALDFTADAPIIGRTADGVLLVVRPGSVEKGQARFTKEILDQSGLNMLGVIFNGVNPQFDSHSYYHVLEEQRGNLIPKQLPGSSSKEELWETISSLSRESKKNKLATDLDEQQLQIAPIEKLESMVFNLQRDLADLTRMVKEQEEELLAQRQKVKKLQRKANLATENELFYLENQLKQEQEIKRMLDETLVGQRRNLEKRRQMLYQYQQVLDSRQNAASVY